MRVGKNGGYVMIRIVDRWRTTEFCDCIGDAHSLTKRHDADLGLENSCIEFQEDVPRNFLLYYEMI
jgi:hypothetical protein